MKITYFKYDCYTDLNELKADYKSLSKKHHPDLGGSDDEMKIINAEFDVLIERLMANKAESVIEERGFDFDINSTPFAEVLKKIINWDIRIEIIGIWIYAFESFELKDQLKELDFFFSKKHKAWIFSGTKKRNIRSGNTTDDNRNIYGSSVVKEKQEQVRIAG